MCSLMPIKQLANCRHRQPAFTTTSLPHNPLILQQGEVSDVMRKEKTIVTSTTDLSAATTCMDQDHYMGVVSIDYAPNSFLSSTLEGG